MTALSTLLAACFGPTCPTRSHRSVTLTVESLEERQVLSGSPLALARPELGPGRSAQVAPEQAQADEPAPPEGWYVAFRRGHRGGWNIRGPIATPLEAALLRKRMRQRGFQVRAPIYIAPPEQPPTEEGQPTAESAPVSITELKRRIIGLEFTIPYEAMFNSWPTRRNGWIADVYSAGSPRELASLIVELESYMRDDAMDPAWAEIRPAWREAMGSAVTPDDVEYGRHVFAEAVLPLS